MPSRLFLLVGLPVLVAAAVPAACARLPAMFHGSTNSRIELASADDCAILVAVGKSELKWGAKPPAAAMLPDFPTTGGGTYREVCAWKELGVAAPIVGDAHSPIAFFVSRPIYSGKSATAFFHYSVASVRLPDGAILPPFFERERCSLEKQADGWHLAGCKLTGIEP